MGLRQNLIEFLAGILRVPISFPAVIPPEPEPKAGDFRLAKVVKMDGTVFWHLEEYFTSRSKLQGKYYGGYEDWKIRPVKEGDRNWIKYWHRLKKKYGTMEEAIDDLNGRIRKNEELEVSFLSVE